MGWCARHEIFPKSVKIRLRTPRCPFCCSHASPGYPHGAKMGPGARNDLQGADARGRSTQDIFEFYQTPFDCFPPTPPPPFTPTTPPTTHPPSRQRAIFATNLLRCFVWPKPMAKPDIDYTSLGDMPANITLINARLLHVF